MSEGGSGRDVAFQDGVAVSSQARYCANKVVTSKYTWYSFLPLNIWEQLHKFGNVYFLLISIVMYLGEKTPLFVGTIKAFSTLGLLIMMMAVTGAMALLDDLRRKEADNEINATEATVVIKGGRTSTKAWSDLAVGDMLLVSQDEEFPADVVPLYCSGDSGNCYVSTANLDGETNLKLKNAPSASQLLLEKDPLNHLSKLSGRVKAEEPSADIHGFSGALAINTGATGINEESLGAKQLLLRGTVLRNTAQCIGVVVYTGADTRMIRNSRPAPLKMSNLERVTNTAMIVILAAQAVLALLSDGLHLMYQEQFKSFWYLHVPDIILPEWLGYFLTFFTLYSNLMPISLYPTAEFCNAFQSYFITNDEKMYYKEKGFNGDKGFNARARSSNLVHELGQVGYILSDKTGTLTQNVMELKRFSVAGEVNPYGHFDGNSLTPGFQGTEEVMAARRDPKKGQAMNDFFEALAVAHTVMATKSDSGELKYEAESPDESALINGVAGFGWRFVNRRADLVEVEVLEQESRPGKIRRYTIHATNEFNSTRKRMSVIVKRESSPDYMLFVKGADNVMLALANKQVTDPQLPCLQRDLKDFSTNGLRTLLIGSRQISDAEFQRWFSSYQEASRETVGRDEKLMKVADQIERDLKILGITAIEDKLQVGVQSTIEKIRKAGIKLWVLTGDKLETARNIGFSTRVLSDEMTIATVDEEEGGSLEDAQELLADVELSKSAMMISGKALEKIWEEESTKTEFLDLAQECSVLIACRVSPMQKAQCVALVRTGIKPTPVTLAVGDGANDVPMIQEAQVGVGIAGREGRQAVNNSDFAIGQFRYLQRLLLVHGRWNYRRACAFTLFTFWRNMVQVLMIVYYTWISGYSGTSLFEDWVRLSFNPLCTLPILAVGCFDKDVEAKDALKHPKLYEVGRLGLDLNVNKVGFMLCSALVHSAALHWITLLAFPSLDLRGSGDYYTFGTMCYSCLVLDVNYRVAFMTNTHNIWTIGSLFLSFVLYVIYLYVYTEYKMVTDFLEPNMYKVPHHMIRNWYFWFCILLVPLLAMTFDMSMHFLHRKKYPDQRDRLEAAKEKEASGKERCSYKELLCDDESQPDSDDEDEDEEDMSSDPDDETINRSHFAQQTSYKMRAQRRICDLPAASFVAALAGLITSVIACVCLWYSAESAQVRIQYAGQAQDQRIYSQSPVGTHDEEKFYKKCAGQQPCRINVQVPRDMNPPILVYYAIGPYYQNHNAYLKSELARELMGEEVTEAQREAKCAQESTRLTPGGEHIVPCGMKAVSFFNDTYKLEVDGQNVSFHESLPGYYVEAAWDSDSERYNNPQDYPNRPNTSWQYTRFPDIIDETLGVRDKDFVTWMRPSAVPRVWNPVGMIGDRTIKEGANLTVTISSTYPAESLDDAYKMLVITEFGPLGARHDGFGILLSICAGLCFFMAVVIFFADKLMQSASSETNSCTDSDDEDEEASE